MNYRKQHLVPTIETGTPGDENPNSTPVTFNSGEQCDTDLFGSRRCGQWPSLTLRIALAICFDFNFPHTMRSAAGADLMIGASHYWGGMGLMTWGMNKFRAVENGFTVYKCSQDGMSGAADPYGRTLALKPMTTSDVWVTQFPVQPAVWTLYAHGGFLFDWACIIAFFFYLCLLLFVYCASESRISGIELLKSWRAPPTTQDESVVLEVAKSENSHDDSKVSIELEQGHTNSEEI